MNRSATAVACVRALAAQTLPPALVVVADNASEDGTVADLQSLDSLPFELITIAMPENLGNAGGIREAMEVAFSREMDAVWILDDDSWPRPKALAALLATPWNPEVVRHAIQIDPTTKRFTWPMLTCDGAKWRLAFDESELPDGNIIPSKSSWTGALVSKRVRDRVGSVNGDLFIRGEDEEYPWRIEEAGFRFEAFREAVLDHPGSKDVLHWQVFGKNLFVERGLADWKLFYKVRNMVWLKRQQNGNFGAIAMALAYALAVSFVDGCGRLPLVWSAARKGWVGELGKWEFH